MPRPQYVKDLLAAGRAHRAGTTPPGSGAWTTPSASSSACRSRRASTSSPTANGGARATSTSSPRSCTASTGSSARRSPTTRSSREPMTPRRPGVIAEEARFLRENTDRHVKVCLPSPYLIGQRMWVPEHSQAAYPTREAFCEALVPVLRPGAAGDPRRRRRCDPARRAAPVRAGRSARCGRSSPTRRPRCAGPWTGSTQIVEGVAGRDAGGAPLPPQLGPPRLGRGRRLRGDPAAHRAARRSSS